jgi:tight adherence protein B
MQQSLIIGVLLVLVLAAALTLVLDSRQTRIDRQVDLALSARRSESVPSIRRTAVQSRWGLVQRLSNYRPGIAYPWGPAYVLPAAALVAAAIIYFNRFVDFPTVYISPMAALAALMVVRGLFGWQRGRLAEQLFRQLPDTINMVTSAIRSGLPVNEAFRAIAREMPQPTRGQFGIVCSEMAFGKPAEEAIEGVYRRTQVPEYGFFAVTLGVQIKSGGGLAETLQTLADTVRERVALAARAKAMAGEVIFSARALSLAPWIAGVLLYWQSPSSVDMLFYDPFGRKLLAYAVTSVILGTLVIRWMVKRDTAL